MIKRLIFFSILIAFSSCSRDTATEPDCSTSGVSNQTYQEVRLILSESCAYATSCHLNGGVNDDFDSYDGVVDFLENNGLNVFLSDVNSGRMPPEYAEEGKREISPLQKLQLICWIEDGYPEE